MLLTNATLAGRSGTETVIRDLALALLRAGHLPMVYSPWLGPIADELRRASIPVAQNIDAIRETPDVIHGHHVIQTAVAAVRFPTVPAIFVCHDFTAWHDVPPRLPNLRAFVTISDGFRERLVVEEGVAPSDVWLIPNAVDVNRFRPGAPPPATPRRALAFAKNHGHLAAIREACARREIVLEVVGAAAGRLIDTPEDILPDYDLVFASALTAIEAMACLRPVIVCDGRGLAGLATSERYEGWRRENFGLRVLSRPVTVDNILAELDLYDPEDAVAVGLRVRDEAHIEGWSRAHETLYRQVIADFARAEPIDAEDRARATAVHLQTWNPGLDIGRWTGERALLLEEIERLSSHLEPIALGETVDVLDSRRLCLSGFHGQEAWAGAWSARPRCGVRFRLESGAKPKQVTIVCTPFFPPSRPAYDVILKTNGEPFGRLRLDETKIEANNAYSQTFELPEGDFAEICWLSFETERCISPASEGLSTDSRELGFALMSIALN